VIDISGIIESIEWYLGKWLGGKVIIPKPFSCSLCMCFWMGLLWLLIQSQFTLFNVMVVCLIAAFSEQITNAIIILKQLIAKLEDKLITNR
jgi:hypothetical protein